MWFKRIGAVVGVLALAGGFLGYARMETVKLDRVCVAQADTEVKLVKIEYEFNEQLKELKSEVRDKFREAREDTQEVRNDTKQILKILLKK